MGNVELTAYAVAKETGIHRSTTYDVLDRLIQKGLVSFIIKEKIKYFQANEPTKISEYLEQKEKEIQKNKENIDKLIPLLIKQRGAGKDTSVVQVYEGFKGVTAAHEHLFERLKKGEEFYCFGIPSFQEEKYHDYWQKDHLKRIKAGITCKLLFNKETPKKVLKNRNSFKGCDSRYMPAGIETPAWMMTYKNIALIILQSEKGMSIEIINDEIAKSFKSYFDALWKLSKPFKK